MIQIKHKIRRQRGSIVTSLSLALFLVGFAAIQRISALFRWVHDTFGVVALASMETNWYLEPTISLLYLTLGAHLLFDLRPAFDPADRGIYRAVQASAIVYVGGFLFFAIQTPPASFGAVASTIASASELWTVLSSVAVPITFAVFTTYDWREGVKSAAVLTGVAVALPALGYYAENVTSPLDYTSTFAFLADPLFEASVQLFTGMINGFLIAGIVFALRVSKDRISEKVAA